MKLKVKLIKCFSIVLILMFILFISYCNLDGLFGGSKATAKKNADVDDDTDSDEADTEEHAAKYIKAIKSLKQQQKFVKKVVTTIEPVKITVERFHNRLNLVEKGMKKKQEIDIDDDINDIRENKIRGNEIYPTTVLNKLALKKQSPDLTKKHSNILVAQAISKKGEFKKRFPKAIIAGVKKGGTRALLSFLGKHPLVRSGGKEMHFFDKNERYEKGLDYYLDQMPKSFENEMTIEKTPGYFVKPYVPQRIYKFNKNIKLIFILREPVQRAISDYAQALSKEGKELKRFENLIFKKSNSKIVDPKSSKVSIGLYVKHLKNWLQYFPLKQMYFVNGDEFIKNPVREIKNVQKFLKLPIMIDEDSFLFNKTKGFYCIIVKREYTGDVNPDCLGSDKGRKHPDVSASTLKKLTDFYRPYNKKLFSILQKDFHWPT